MNTLPALFTQKAASLTAILLLLALSIWITEVFFFTLNLLQFFMDARLSMI